MMICTPDDDLVLFCEGGGYRRFWQVISGDNMVLRLALGLQSAGRMIAFSKN